MTTQPITNLRDLQRGDIVRHRNAGDSYVIENVDGRGALGVRTILITNHDEWLLVKPDNRFNEAEALEIAKRAIKQFVKDK